MSSVKGAQMIYELDSVVLTRDVGEYGLKKGDLGAVVHVYEEGDAYEVEFVTAGGRTVAVLTLEPADIRSTGSHDMPHIRELSTA
jgi:hypothetical protein